MTLHLDRAPTLGAGYNGLVMRPNVVDRTWTTLLFFNHVQYFGADSEACHLCLRVGYKN